MDRRERSGQVRALVERDRRELRAAVRELKDAVRTQVPAGPGVGDRPYTWLLGTFLIGLWLGARRAGGREVEP